MLNSLTKTATITAIIVTSVIIGIMLMIQPFNEVKSFFGLLTGFSWTFLIFGFCKENENRIMRALGFPALSLYLMVHADKVFIEENKPTALLAVLFLFIMGYEFIQYLKIKDQAVKKVESNL